MDRHSTAILLASLAPMTLGACVTPVPSDAYGLAGRSWKIVSVNKQDLSDHDDFTIRFTGKRIEGRFGCLTFDTSYSITDDIIRTAPYEIKGEPCTGEMMEEVGAALLQSGMTLQSVNDGVVLLNPPTSIFLIPKSPL